MAGTLYLVSTPIGNLEDLSERASRVLREVHVCFAEDTRRTGRLLKAAGSEAALRSLHAHNEAARVEEVLARLAAGEDCAVVSDAGTPAVSDPGRRAVAAAHDAGCSVVPVPGASAVPAALAASGLPADRFLFLGFPPRSGSERERWIRRAAECPDTTVAFESPRRLSELLEDLVDAGLGGRVGVVCREMTKVHEEIRRGTVEALAAFYDGADVRGEVTLVLEGTGEPEGGPEETPEAARRVARTLAGAGCTTRDIAERLQHDFGLSRNDAYREGLLAGEEVGQGGEGGGRQ